MRVFVVAVAAESAEESWLKMLDTGNDGTDSCWLLPDAAMDGSVTDGIEMLGVCMDGADTEGEIGGTNWTVGWGNEKPGPENGATEVVGRDGDGIEKTGTENGGTEVVGKEGDGREKSDSEIGTELGVMSEAETGMLVAMLIDGVEMDGNDTIGSPGVVIGEIESDGVAIDERGIDGVARDRSEDGGTTNDGTEVDGDGTTNDGTEVDSGGTTNDGTEVDSGGTANDDTEIEDGTDRAGGVAANVGMLDGIYGVGVMIGTLVVGILPLRMLLT